MKSVLKLLIIPALVLMCAGNDIELHLPLGPGVIHRESMHHLKGPKVGLVLSGGGARGMSHIGVIKALEELDVDICLVAGTSSGAIIGALYSAGYSPSEIEDIVREQDWEYLFSSAGDRQETFATQKMDNEGYVIRFRLDGTRIVLPKGYTSGSNIDRLLYDYLSPANFTSGGSFDRLSIPFRTVATDLVTGKPVIFDSGDLPFAVKCASAIPLFFAPILLDDMYLVDGGLVYPIPTEIAESLGCDVIICVDVTAPREKPVAEINAPWVVLTQTTAIMAEETKAREKKLADICIRPDGVERELLDFGNIGELIDAGYQATISLADSIIALTSVEDYSSRVFDSIIWTGESLYLQPGSPVTTTDILDEMDRLRCTHGYENISCTMGCGVLQMNAVLPPDANHVSLSGISIFSMDSLESLYNVTVEGRWNSFRADSITEAISAEYRRRGFVLAGLDTAWLSSDTMHITFTEGRIERILIEGNEYTKSWVIHNLIPLNEGGIFNINRLNRGIKNIQSTDLFENVYYNIQRGQTGAVLFIHLLEKPQPVIGLRAHYDTHREGTVGISLHDENFLGTGQRIEMGNRYGKWLKEFYVTHSADRLWKSYFTSRFTLHADGQRIEYYDSFKLTDVYSLQTIGMEFLLGQQIKRFGTVFAGIAISRKNLVNLDNTIVEIDETRDLLVRSIVDTYDNYDFPHHGKHHISEFMLSQDILGGDQSFWRFCGSYESWYSKGRWAYHPHISGGYSAGGLMPGYMLFTIGEMIPFYGLAGDELRGWSFVNTGIEGRVQLTEGIFPVYVKAGLSLGRVWQKDAQLELQNTVSGEGVELSIGTPIGPLRAGFGVLNTHDQQFWSVSIGRK